MSIFAGKLVFRSPPKGSGRYYLTAAYAKVWAVSSQSAFKGHNGKAAFTTVPCVVEV